MATVYKSKIDLWIALVLAAAAVISAVAALQMLSSYAPGAKWIALLIGGIGILLPLVAVLTTRYALEGDRLIVRSGPIKWNIPVSEISAITPTNDPIASPALSLSRLRIEYGNKKAVLISPRDRDGFLQQVASIRGAV